jgi:hypothetical protein
MAIQCKGEIVVSLMHNMGYLFIFSLILYECGPGEAAHTIASNMKRCLRFSTFISLIMPNLAKYSIGLSSLEQHHEIEKRKRKKYCLSVAILIPKKVRFELRDPDFSLSIVYL